MSLIGTWTFHIPTRFAIFCWPCCWFKSINILSVCDKICNNAMVNRAHSIQNRIFIEMQIFMPIHSNRSAMELVFVSSQLKCLIDEKSERDSHHFARMTSAIDQNNWKNCATSIGMKIVISTYHHHGKYTVDCVRQLICWL